MEKLKNIRLYVHSNPNSAHLEGLIAETIKEILKQDLEAELVSDYIMAATYSKEPRTTDATTHSLGAMYVHTMWVKLKR